MMVPQQEQKLQSPKAREKQAWAGQPWQGRGSIWGLVVEAGGESLWPTEMIEGDHI